MRKINRFLMMLIAMVAIMITAVGIDRGMKHYNIRKWEKERHARYEQAYADVADIEMTISTLSRDQKAIEEFLEENKDYFEDLTDYLIGEVLEDGENSIEGGQQIEEPEGMEGMGFWDSREEAVSGNELSGEENAGQGDVSANALNLVLESWSGSVSGNDLVDASGKRLGSVSGNGLVDVSGNQIGSVSGNELVDASGGRISSVSGNELRDLIINWLESEFTTQQENAPENHQEGMAERYGEEGYGKTLQERRKIRTSYMETQMRNTADRRLIEESGVDFSQISIACLGDSITEAANLSGEENYQQYSYPARLEEILGAERVTNLGIGGSSIGRYWENAFVDRYRDIPEDTDLIIVMGGTNDGFCMDQEELGTVEERKERTFIGDLDELMRGLKENYPDAQVVFVTPLPNVLHDILRKERDYLLPQTAIVNAIKYLAQEYEIPVIDLYNSNILDTHDAAVIYNYMPDGVHCNSEGYTLLAEHIAAELIRLYEEPAGEDAE